jgi:hypothetical protein
MRKCTFLFFVPATLLLNAGWLQAPSSARIESDGSDGLRPYTACRFSGGLSVVEVNRLPGSGLRYRTIQNPDGPRKISMLDGYRVMLAVPGKSYFANMHVEKSEPSQYLSDKDAVIKGFGSIVSQSGSAIVPEHRSYNGFDMYASSDATMEGHGPTGMYVLFRDSEQVIVTIYFVDQKPEDRKFKTLAEYKALTEKVLEDLTNCVKQGTARTETPVIQTAGLSLRDTLVVDAFDTVTQWSTNPSAGVEISVHSDRGRHGPGMRVDFDFHGHGGYGIVHREVSLELPENYEFTFAVRGLAPRNTLEFKLVDPSHQSVWWSNNPNFAFPAEWTTISRKKRQICFAWGPAEGGYIRRVAAIEFAITAGSGGKGSLWFDDLSISPLTPDSPFDVTPPIAAIPLIGTWGSAATSSRGIGGTLDFATDGWVNTTIAATGAFTYSIADNRLTTVFHDMGGDTRRVHTAPIRVEHDILIEADDSLSGKGVTMARIRSAKPGDDPILGFWGYTDATGAANFVAFAKDGRGLLRVPVSSCSGTWTDSGTGQVTLTVNGQGPKVWNYSIENNVLTLKNDQGIELKYNRRAFTHL